MEDELAHIKLPVIAGAVKRLEQQSVMGLEDGSVRASRAARRLDELELIGV